MSVKVGTKGYVKLRPIAFGVDQIVAVVQLPNGAAAPQDYVKVPEGELLDGLVGSVIYAGQWIRACRSMSFSRVFAEAKVRADVVDVVSLVSQFASKELRLEFPVLLVTKES